MRVSLLMVFFAGCFLAYVAQVVAKPHDDKVKAARIKATTIDFFIMIGVVLFYLFGRTKVLEVVHRRFLFLADFLHARVKFS